jgi:hypothetical protein
MEVPRADEQRAARVTHRLGDELVVGHALEQGARLLRHRREVGQQPVAGDRPVGEAGGGRLPRRRLRYPTLAEMRLELRRAAGLE